MSNTILIAIEYIVSAACDINGINETVFTESIGKVPKGFLVAGGDEIELVIDTANGAALHLAVQEETGGDGAIADEDELTEERATLFLNVVLDFLASGYADDAVAA